MASPIRQTPTLVHSSSSPANLGSVSTPARGKLPAHLIAMAASSPGLQAAPKTPGRPKLAAASAPAAPSPTTPAKGKKPSFGPLPTLSPELKAKADAARAASTSSLAAASAPSLVRAESIVDTAAIEMSFADRQALVRKAQARPATPIKKAATGAPLNLTRNKLPPLPKFVPPPIPGAGGAPSMPPTPASPGLPPPPPMPKLSSPSPVAPKAEEMKAEIDKIPLVSRIVESSTGRSWSILTYCSIGALALGALGIAALAVAVFAFSMPISLPFMVGVGVSGSLLLLGGAGLYFGRNKAE